MNQESLMGRVNTRERLAGQNIVIMGGSSGIGLAVAIALVQSGANVTITGRSQEKLNSVARDLQLNTHLADATSRVSLEDFYQQHGSFDHLILSIGGAEGGGPFRTLDMERLQQGFENKFWAQIRAVQLALKTLRNDGSVTLVTSSAARRPNLNTSGLAAINGALEAMVRVLAAELRPLRVNAVSPGVVDTPLWSRFPEQQRQRMLSGLASLAALGRIGRPDEIADAVCFVVRNEFMTGAVIECDGGIRLT